MKYVNIKKIKETVAKGAMILMIGSLVGCGKKPAKTPSEPTRIETVTPTDGVTPTNTVEPTVTSTPVVEPTATVTVAPTSTPTPTPIESKITTVTKPSKVEGYTEITSLSAKDIKEGSMIQEYDKVLEVKDYAETMDLGNVTSDDLVASLEDNTALDAETKKP